jgi:hypothetical protein
MPALLPRRRYSTSRSVKVVERVVCVSLCNTRRRYSTSRSVKVVERAVCVSLYHGAVRGPACLVKVAG